MPTAPIPTISHNGAHESSKDLKNIGIVTHVVAIDPIPNMYAPRNMPRAKKKKLKKMPLNIMGRKNTSSERKIIKTWMRHET